MHLLTCIYLCASIYMHPFTISDPASKHVRQSQDLTLSVRIFIYPSSSKIALLFISIAKVSVPTQPKTI